MFAKLSLLAAALPFVYGLTLDTPTNVTSGGRTTISWTSTETDPTFSLELNHPDFRAALAIANNLDPLRQSSVDLTIPTVTEFDSSYTISAVNISNINDVFATSGDFAIDPPISSSNSGSSTSSSASTVSGSASGTSSGASATSTTPGTSSGFGTTVSGSASSANSAAASGSASASSPSTSTTQLNGALSLQAGSSSFNAGLLAAMVMSVIAGAATLL